jgi:hypothetical protein
MEYGLQLSIAAEGVDAENKEDASGSVDNWLQNNNPLLQEIPDKLLKPAEKESGFIRVSSLKFGQSDSGYHIYDNDKVIGLKTGDTILYNEFCVRVTITKLSQSRGSAMPILADENLLPRYVDNAALDTIGFLNEGALSDSSSSSGLALLNTTFSTPQFSAARPVLSPRYADVKEDDLPFDGTQRPIDNIDQLFSDYCDTPFTRDVPLHHQGHLRASESKPSLKKMKQLLWGSNL